MPALVLLRLKNKFNLSLPLLISAPCCADEEIFHSVLAEI
jgi:hypothetical protein